MKQNNKRMTARQFRRTFSISVINTLVSIVWIIVIIVQSEMLWSGEMVIDLGKHNTAIAAVLLIWEGFTMFPIIIIFPTMIIAYEGEKLIEAIEKRKQSLK